MALLALPAAAEPQAPLVVVLDPGHGGRWPHDGAHGRRGLHEKVIALQVAQKTKELLEQQGATVILTRDADEDVPLADRVRIANEAGADVFLSIHCNAMETREGRKLGGRTYQAKVAQALADGVRAFADKVLARRLVAQVRSPVEKADGAPVNAAAAVASPGGTR